MLRCFQICVRDVFLPRMTIVASTNKSVKDIWNTFVCEAETILDSSVDCRRCKLTSCVLDLWPVVFNEWLSRPQMSFMACVRSFGVTPMKDRIWSTALDKSSMRSSYRITSMLGGTLSVPRIVYNLWACLYSPKISSSSLKVNLAAAAGPSGAFI